MGLDSATMLVLRKTKLAETDLIVTGFSDEGRQVRAVAKGARRPGSKLGAHLELYSVARVLLRKGRRLDLVTEAFGIDSNSACRADVLHSAGAAAVVELLDKVSADGDTEARLFPLACAALRSVGAVPDEGVPLVTAAAVLKISAQLGFRPSFVRCACCGGAEGGAMPAFSFEQGGVICERCLPGLPEGGGGRRDARLVGWAEVLLNGRFGDLERHADGEHAALGRELLAFSREWLRFHLVDRLRSLDFLLNFPV
ncbi:MAG: DNA repair protein RecO [Coriobacteriales bacterium]|jgi:DNA repair protein RecO (recombination protein O)|nr:DNA repair protein RecO [Coriobacteriales bacterium]